LNAFRIDAKDDFLPKGDVVVTTALVVELDIAVLDVPIEDWEEWTKGLRGACSKKESSEARESPRACVPKGPRSVVVGVKTVGDSSPEFDEAPKPKAPLRPNGMGVDGLSSSSKSARH